MEGTIHGTTHRPVLLAETIGMLAVVPGGLYVDGTLGLGGHSREILERSAPNGRVIAFEWDEAAIARTEIALASFRERLIIMRRNFQEIDAGLAEAGYDMVNGIMIDIGLSSLQLDSGDRGFSFRFDEPLDMRMDRRRTLTATTLLASATEQELADIFYYFGEEKQARRIAGYLVEERRRQAITTTGQLAELVARAVPKPFHPPKIHVATKVFQAVRIAVNDELTNLGRFLDRAVHHLLPGGRLCVISFHSLEDRIVKRAFAGAAELKVLTKKPIVPGREEIGANPRSRSARLRVAERLA
ncbi:16S rRNA (cytosine(1402)-N(4))-methyltransferase RsmH [Desulfofustis glycolicus]|uniref:Ribosomal RNA small subunit methyltransferase H n=1 Tax=Desulfofustis glycolicus DSM 9705 TaxID=1121409 RepID=A0A1M5XWH1_9BACT|nr:16S rRNA (cytosine(1402)-N(4))-methyltransferase RsmH [Desulfofustis glycolicus]SHI04150.1 16S rRNA (cytosine1402-N4)-methyltransferase [Desulfofustis glycolicus DSM 9705]